MWEVKHATGTGYGSTVGFVVVVVGIPGSRLDLARTVQDRNTALAEENRLMTAKTMLKVGKGTGDGPVGRVLGIAVLRRTRPH